MTRRPARARAFACALALLALLAGCAGIPTSGDILSEERPAASQGAGEVSVTVEGPAQGAKPNTIINGFLLALAQYQPGYVTARQYLSDDLAAEWRPGLSVQIYADLAGLTVTQEDDQAIARIPSPSLVGSLDSGGVYTPGAGLADPLEFVLEPDADGEWRIVALPEGLGVIMTRAQFNNAYQRVDTYYFDDQGEALIPDTRYVPRGNWLRQPIEALLAGPSERVAGMVDASLVTSVALDPDSEPALDGTTIVIPLTAAARSLTSAQVTRLALLCAATLRQLPGIEAVRLTAGGQVLAFDGTAVGGGVPVSAVAQYDLNSAQSAIPPALLGVRDGVVVSFETSSWPGELGSVQREIAALAVGARGDRVAVTTAEALLAAAAGADARSLVEAAGLVRPQYDADNRVWAMAADDTGTTVWLADQGSAQEIAAPAFEGLAVRAFRFAGDGRRLAVVADDLGGEGGTRLGLVQLRYDDAGVPYLDGWRDVPVVVDDAALAAVQDVAWLGPSSLAVLGTPAGSDVNAVYRVRLDGVEQVEELGRPTQAAVIGITSSAGGANLAVLDASGEAYRWLDTREWDPLGENLTAIAYPG